MPNPENSRHVELTDEQWEAVKKGHEDDKIILSRGGSKKGEVQTDTDSKIEENQKKEEKKEQKPKNPFEVTIVDASELAEAQARDRGDARMTESKEDRSKSWLKRTATRIWKHNLAQEYYRQKEISNARKEILEKDNLFAGEGSDAEAKAALIERFAAEYDDEFKGQMLKEGETISPESVHLNAEIKLLINEHAKKPMSEEVFREERNRILGHYAEKPGKTGAFYADNLFNVAEEVRKAVEHGQKIEELNLNIKVKLGKAKEALNTTAKGTSFDKGVEWLQNSKVGKYFVNEGVLTAAAAAYSTAKYGAQRLLRSKAVQLGTFGGAMLLSSALAGVKESARMERERAQYNREAAKGLTNDKDSRRRQEFANVNYETLPAVGIISVLEESLQKLKEKSVDQGVILNDLADIEARILVGEEKRVDLFRYSDPSAVEAERTKLLIARAKLKNALKQEMGEDDFNVSLGKKVGGFADELVRGEEGINKRDIAFKKLKWQNIGKQSANTLIAGTVMGTVTQEAGALIKSAAHSWFGWGKGEDSWIQGMFKHVTGRTDKLNQNATMLESVRRYFSGETPRMPMGNETLGAIHNPFGGSEYDMRLPEGVSLADHGNGTFDIVRNGETIASHIKAFTTSGQPNPDLKLELLKHDIYAGNQTMVGGHDPQSALDYVKDHQGNTKLIHRELHYDNDTKVFDKNELQEKWGGGGIRNSFDHQGNFVGYEGSGVDDHGNYVLNVGRMSPDGSYHNHFSVDAQKAMQAGKLKMLFSLSRDTQQHVFEVQIDAQGNAIIPRDSEIAKLMFENHNGQAVFTGKYAEVAEVTGNNSGAESVRILSTVVGKGHDMIYDPAHPTIRLDLPGTTDYNIPPFIPAVPRKPLEEGIGREKPAAKTEETKVETVKTSEEKKAFEVEVKKEEVKEKPKPKPDPDAIVAETGPWNDSELVNKEMTKEEHDALREDLEFINKKIQGHEGIITVQRSDLKSEYALEQFNKLRHIPEGDNPIVFNKSELRQIGDGVETGLSKAKIIEGEKTKSKKAPPPNNLPTGKAQRKELPEVVIDAIDRAVVKQLRGEPLTKGEQEALKRNPEEVAERLAFLKEQYPQYNTAPNTTNVSSAPKNPSQEGQLAKQKASGKEAAFERAEKRWATDQDKALLRYLAYADTNKVPAFLNKQYDNEHDNNGNLKPEWQNYANKILEIEANKGEKETFLRLADELHKYVTNAMKLWKAPLDKNTQSKSWAYYGILKMQTAFENNGKRARDGKDPIGNILKKDNPNASALLQSMADAQFGYVFSRADTRQKNALMRKIAGTTQEPAILALMQQTQGENETENRLKPAQLIELGTLVRESQDEAAEKAHAKTSVPAPESEPTPRTEPETVTNPEELETEPVAPASEPELGAELTPEVTEEPEVAEVTEPAPEVVAVDQKPEVATTKNVVEEIRERLESGFYKFPGKKEIGAVLDREGNVVTAGLLDNPDGWTADYKLSDSERKKFKAAYEADKKRLAQLTKAK